MIKSALHEGPERTASLETGHGLYAVVYAYFSLLGTYEATATGSMSLPRNTYRFWHFFWQALEDGLRFVGELARCVWGERQGNGPSCGCLTVVLTGGDAKVLSHFLLSLSSLYLLYVYGCFACMHVWAPCAYLEPMGWSYRQLRSSTRWVLGIKPESSS